MEYVLSIFSALADAVRLRSLALLNSQGELCVCELVEALQVSQPKMSRHLAALREAGLVRDRRDAQWVLYSIAPDLPPWVSGVMEAAAAGLAATAEHSRDLSRLKGMSRPLRQRAAEGKGRAP